MKKARLRSASVVGWFTVIVLLISPVWAKERRTALVIGNADYHASPLANPANDALDMAKALRKLNFKVTLNIDANQRTMEESIRAFGKSLHAGGVGLFYYAGHGLQYRGRNYLIPIQSDIRSEADIKYEAVDAGRVLAQMEAAGNSLNIIILDACRNNPFGRSFRSAERGLAKMDAPAGSILAYATAPGSVASDGTGRNGLYTSALLKHITAPGIDLPHLFMKVRKDVINATQMKQVPWESSSLIGEFYFSPKRAIVVAEKPAVKKPEVKPPPAAKPAATAKTPPAPKWIPAEPTDIAMIAPPPKRVPSQPVESAKKPPAPKLIQSQPAQVAKVPPSPNLRPSHSGRQKKVAILPFVLDSGGRYYKESIASITTKVLHSRDFSVEWSYYDMYDYRTVTIIDDRILGTDTNGKVWKKKSIFSKSQPDLELIYHVGDKLKADFAVIGVAKIEAEGAVVNRGYIDIYMIDIHNRKIVSAKMVSTNSLMYAQEFFQNFERSLKGYIDEELS